MTGPTRRDVLRAGFAMAAFGGVAKWSMGGPASATTTAPFLPYSTDSFFRSPVIGAPIDELATAAFRTFVNTHPEQRYAYPLVNGIGSNKWGTAYAEGSATDPIWKLINGNIPKVCADLRTAGFHAPSWLGDMLSGTSDSPVVVMDRGSGQSVWAAKAKLAGPRTIDVGAAGRFKHSSNGLDRRNPRSNGSKNERTRGCIPDGMVIRRDLMDAGIANGTGLGHVLHMFFVQTDGAAGFCHPMVNCETRHTGWGAQGLRVAIDPAVDLTTRGLSSAALVVARTLQQHGCYLGDNSGSGSALKAEQAASTRDPWAGLDVSQRMLTGITWDDFVVLPQGWQ